MLRISKRFITISKKNQHRVENTENIPGKFLHLKKTPKHSNIDDVKDFLLNYQCPLPSKFMKVFIGAGDKRCDWLLEYDDKESNDRALICLHNKKFGLHTIKPAIINEASVIPGISQNPDKSIGISNLSYKTGFNNFVKELGKLAPDLKIKTAKIMRTQGGGNLGKAYIAFETEEEATLASIFLHNKNYKGKDINVMTLT